MLLTWLLTVRSLMTSRSAICALVSPVAMRSQHLTLALAECVVEPACPGGRAMQFLRQPRRDMRMERRLAPRRLAHRADQFVQPHALEQIRERASAYRRVDMLVLVIGREHDHLRARTMLLDESRRRHAVHLRHHEVHQDDIGREVRREQRRLAARSRLADDLEAALGLEQRADALAHDGVVVHDHDRDRLRHAPTSTSCAMPPASGVRASRRVPLAPLLMVSAPPSASTRSRMLARPRPFPADSSTTKPCPSSRTVISSVSSVHASCIST